MKLKRFLVSLAVLLATVASVAAAGGMVPHTVAKYNFVASIPAPLWFDHETHDNQVTYTCGADEPFRLYTIAVFNNLDFTQTTGHEMIDAALKNMAKSLEMQEKPAWGKDSESNEYATVSLVMHVPAGENTDAFNVYTVMRFIAVPRLGRVYEVSMGQKAGPDHEDPMTFINSFKLLK
jgi:hypothetical protein